jgi:acetyl-CoA C-acetyltransferase
MSVTSRNRTELNDQVTATAGDYQVDGARVFQTLNIGGSGTTSVNFVVGCA